MSAPGPLALERAGFVVSQHNGGKHWLLIGRGLKVDYWPSSNKFQVFGKVFQASVQDFIQAAQSGQYTKPDNPPVRCKRCRAPIYWVKTRRDKWMPLNEDGGPHLAHCRRVQ